jgi:catechol 2,3-dioxygenase-like lactoylglutathione lyase family enzyme
MSNLHMHLYVADLEASRSFYQRFFGLSGLGNRPARAEDKT